MSKKFESLIAEALAVEREYRAHISQAKMSVDAIVTECLRQSGSTLKKLADLEKALEGRADFLKHCQAFVRQIQGWFSNRRCSHGIPRSVSRMAVPSRDPALAELSANGYTAQALWLLWAIAAKNASLKALEQFGSITNMPEWERRAEGLNERRQDLFNQIATSYQPDDLVIGKLERDGRARVDFAVVSGEVPLVPLLDAGSRLVNHLLSTAPEKWSDVQTDTQQIQQQAG